MFHVDHTLNHIRFLIDHGKIIGKMYDLCGTIYDQSMINLVEKPGMIATPAMGSQRV